MKSSFLLSLFLSFLFCSCANSQSRAQILEDINKIDTQYYNCLDKGENMYYCSLIYFNKSDSMLNFVYKLVMKNLPSLEKDSLKKAQRAWLLKRDSAFKSISVPSDLGISGLDQDAEMIIIQKKSEIVMDRVIELVGKYLR